MGKHFLVLYLKGLRHREFYSKEYPIGSLAFSLLYRRQGLFEKICKDLNKIIV
jgi:hypothetical protein